MKEQAIQKINKIGKVSSIITLICKIFVGMGMGLLLLSAIVLFVIPKESIQFTATEQVVVEVDVEKFGVTLTEADAEALREELAAGTDNMTINGEEVETEDVEVIDSKIRFTDNEQMFSVDFQDLAWALVMLLLMLALMMVTLCFFGALCKAFRDCQTPFEENVIKKMQRVAYALIPWIIASSVIDSITNSLLAGRADITFSLDVGMLLIVLVVFLLTYIFKYGAVLQQESDETL